MSIKKFHEIFALEVAAINGRRENKRPLIALEQEDQQRDGTPVMRPTPGSNVVGLALSGGGIRSSAFCLGAMQALDDRGLIDRIDYLSTVSGGGYIGTSMTAAMSTGTAGKFPFPSELRKDEVAGVQHIRDHSNYLFPQGLLNLFGHVVVYLRGLVANAILLLPLLLLAAAFTISLHPGLPQAMHAKHLVHWPISVDQFGLTLNALLAFVILLAVWALWRSLPWGLNKSDVGFGARFFGFVSGAILVVAFFELQPLLLSGMFKFWNSPKGATGFFVAAFTWLKPIAAFLASIGTIVGFLGRFLADALKRVTEKPGFAAFATRIAIKLAMYLAGAAVPLALWVAYLYLSSWGIQNCMARPCTYCTPKWLATLAGSVPFIGGSILFFYVVTGVTLLVISWLLLSANANSLHRLYRDRLSKAFLFDPSRRMAADTLPRVKGQTGAESDASLRNSDLQPLHHLKVSELKTDQAPYHLINAALNIEASKYANRRGRNAED